jgi:hypothetical protein
MAQSSMMESMEKNWSKLTLFFFASTIAVEGSGTAVRVPLIGANGGGQLPVKF